MSRTFVGFAALSMLASSPSALAQPTQTAPQQPSAKQTPDPNEVVCEKEQDSGSRLVTRRICMTRSQWAEQRRLNRQDIEKIQTQRPCVDKC
jgi:invasion protein IalB